MHSLPDAIARVRADGRHQQIRCPAHDDQKASLSIDAGHQGGVVVKCHAGCQTRTVMEAGGLTMADLLPDQGRTGPDIVATYSYQDERGHELYQVLRLAPKSFRQRRSDGAGGWIWQLNGVRRVLYRLPKLQDHETVWIVEGEKDADRLASEGLPATTWSGGATAWRADYVAQLIAAGAAEIVIIPDNDEPGRKCAHTILAAALRGGLSGSILDLPGLPPKGDVSDWLDAGHTVEDLYGLATCARAQSVPSLEDCPVCGRSNCENPTHAIPFHLRGTNPVPSANGNGHHPNSRIVRLTPASTITPVPVRWLWDERLALGTFGLVGGREGIGKSLCMLTLAADLTQGRLPGVYFGQPKSVILAASEDSWGHTIVPRLMAAGADLSRFYRVNVATTKILDDDLSLPDDLGDLERLIPEHDVALVILDPLLSRLQTKLDSHKDAEVRQALEPIVTLADRTGCAVIGLIHVNKSGSTDALTSLMGSRAFAAVARAVLFVMKDPEHEDTRLLGQAKNNLGRTGLPTRTFTVASVNVAPQGDEAIWTGKLEWAGDTDRSIREILSDASTVDTEGHASAVTDAAAWLTDYMQQAGGQEDSNTIRRAAVQAGHSKNTIYKAKERLGLMTTSVGFPRRVFWSIPSSSALDSVPSAP